MKFAAVFGAIALAVAAPAHAGWVKVARRAMFRELVRRPRRKRSAGGPMRDRRKVAQVADREAAAEAVVAVVVVRHRSESTRRARPRV